MRDRGVSTVVTWSLTLLITTILVAGLVVATGGQIEDRASSVTETELEVVGQQVAADIQIADRLARGGDTVVVRTSLPDRTAVGGYRVAVRTSGTAVSVVLESGDVSVSVPVANRTAVRESSVTGGDLRVVLDDGALEVRAQ